jgi:hypothetical protein
MDAEEAAAAADKADDAVGVKAGDTVDDSVVVGSGRTLEVIEFDGAADLDTDADAEADFVTEGDKVDDCEDCAEKDAVFEVVSALLLEIVALIDGVILDVRVSVPIAVGLGPDEAVIVMALVAVASLLASEVNEKVVRAEAVGEFVKEAHAEMEKGPDSVALSLAVPEEAGVVVEVIVSRLETEADFVTATLADALGETEALLLMREEDDPELVTEGEEVRDLDTLAVTESVIADDADRDTFDDDDADVDTLSASVAITDGD